MPSPVGHALAGVAVGYLVALGRERPAWPPEGLWAALMRLGRSSEFLVFGSLGMLPDVDFLLGAHSTYTHSVGAVAIVGCLAGALLAGRPRAYRVRYGLAAAAAYGSHLLLDWLGTDDTAPFGIMALWPLNDQFFLSGREWFLSVCRQYGDMSCWRHNAQGLAWEIALLAPLALGIALLARRR